MEKIFNLSAGIAMLTLLTGCMSFNNSEVPLVENKPPKFKPIVEMKLGKFIQTVNGKKGLKVGSNRSMGYNTLTNILVHWKRKGLIKDYGTVGAFKEKADYILELSGKRDEDMSFFGSFICGFTFFIIPSSTTMKYDLHLRLINQKTKVVYKQDVSDSFTMWMNIIFLPVLPFSTVGIYNMFTDLSMYSYSEFEKQGAFNYSSKKLIENSK
ncbi:MAG: hypothetical protein KOO69_02905 [Victivallales bacterium]|nr:hypothetical protein [Victivallales bacterium]